MYLKIPSSFDSLDFVYKSIKDFCCKKNLDAHDIHVVMDEIISNILKYGFNRKKYITIHMEKLSSIILINLYYNGRYFNINNYQNEYNINSILDGGLGIHLIKQLTSKIFCKKKKRYSKLTICLPFNDTI